MDFLFTLTPHCRDSYPMSGFLMLSAIVIGKHVLNLYVLVMRSHGVRVKAIGIPRVITAACNQQGINI